MLEITIEIILSKMYYVFRKAEQRCMIQSFEKMACLEDLKADILSGLEETVLFPSIDI